MISFADRRLRSEEWHWAGIVVLVRGDVAGPWHTDRCRLQRHPSTASLRRGRHSMGKAGKTREMGGCQRSAALAQALVSVSQQAGRALASNEGHTRRRAHCAVCGTTPTSDERLDVRRPYRRDP
jgi:hypothetical protein